MQRQAQALGANAILITEMRAFDQVEPSYGRGPGSMQYEKIPQYRGKGLNLVILDACRNNPFESKVRGRSRGLARVKTARGTLVAYATEPGSVAEAGDGSNGVYTLRKT